MCVYVYILFKSVHTVDNLFSRANSVDNLFNNVDYVDILFSQVVDVLADGKQGTRSGLYTIR